MRTISVEYYPSTGYTRVWITYPNLPGQGWNALYFECEQHARDYASQQGAQFTVMAE